MATIEEIRDALLTRIKSQIESGDITEFREGQDSASMSNALELIKALGKTSEQDVINAAGLASADVSPRDTFEPLL